MSPVKYSITPVGRWARDGNNLPCLQLDGEALAVPAEPWVHVVSTGRFAAATDPYGRIRLFVPDAANAGGLSPVPAPAGGLFLTLTSANGSLRAFLASEFRDENKPGFSCGIGYASYSAELLFPDDCVAAMSLDVVASPEAATVLILKLGLRLVRGEAAAFTCQVTVDLAAGPGDNGPPRRSFCRNGTAMLAEVSDTVGDFFLAGDVHWKAAAGRQSLQVSREIPLALRKPVLCNLVVGCRRDASVKWIQEQVLAADPGTACKAWTTAVNPSPVKTPDLWMQEECLWNNGVLLACRAWDAVRQARILSPGGDFFPLAMPAGRTGIGLGIRDTLMLCFAVRERFPELVQETLRSLTARQARNGRLPERFADGAAPTHLTPATDRSDLELWFLLAWTDFAATVPDPDPLLTAAVPFATGDQAPVWEHLWLAYRWLRDSVQVGAHGLIRILAGDWCPFLDAVGTDGRGESVVNTAMAVVACEKLLDLARRREQAARADEIDSWLRELRAAANATFSGRWFRRGYTDAGSPIGDVAEGRLFLDAQTWAILACCGTAEQRELAMQETLTRNTGATGLRLLSLPYPPPAEISNLRLPGGESWNGGVSLPAAHWFVWALAAHGKKTLAITEWERLTQRRLAADFADTPAGRRFALGDYASDAAGSRAGGPGVTGPPTSGFLPAAHAVAWQEFALRRILG